MGLAESLTFLPIDLLLDEQIHSDNDQIRDDIHHSDGHKDLGVLEWDLLGYLHHPKDDHQVGATFEARSVFVISATGNNADLHLWVDHGEG